MSDKPVPDALRRAGILGVSSNLQAGDRVMLPTSTFMTLFGDELIDHLQRQKDKADATVTAAPDSR